jgi:hypothetical protein
MHAINIEIKIYLLINYKHILVHVLQDHVVDDFSMFALSNKSLKELNKKKFERYSLTNHIQYFPLSNSLKPKNMVLETEIIHYLL